jgi:CheY-like chemotaxis protein
MTKILVVPKNLLPQESTESLLSRRALTVHSAASAEEALSSARKWRPALILFSSRLPRMGVRKFCQSVRTDPDLKKTKLVMLTERVGENVNDFCDLQLDGHLVNPVDIGQLYQTVAGLLNIRLRGKKRVAVDLIARLNVLSKEDDEDVCTTVNILNLSETGTLLESPVLLPVGSLGRMRFYLPGGNGQLSVYSIVRMLTDEILLHYGVEFVAMMQSEKNQLKQFVEQNTANEV